MSRPVQAPLSAIPIPPPGGPFPSQQLQQISGITAEVERETAVAKGNFDTGCTNWLLANSRNRDMQLPLSPKPAPYRSMAVQTASDTDAQSGVVWLWIVEGSEVACPDLPTVAAPVGPNHIHIGKLFYGKFWSSGADNTFEDAATDVPGTSDDSVTGVWRYIPSAMGHGKGWYEKK